MKVRAPFPPPGDDQDVVSLTNRDMIAGEHKTGEDRIEGVMTSRSSDGRTVLAVVAFTKGTDRRVVANYITDKERRQLIEMLQMDTPAEVRAEVPKSGFILQQNIFSPSKSQTVRKHVADLGMQPFDGMLIRLDPIAIAEVDFITVSIDGSPPVLTLKADEILYDSDGTRLIDAVTERVLNGWKVI